MPYGFIVILAVIAMALYFVFAATGLLTMMRFSFLFFIILVFCSFVFGTNALRAKDIQKRRRAKYYFVIGSLLVALFIVFFVIIQLLIKSGYYL